MIAVTLGYATCSVKENSMSDFDNFFSACEGAFSANGMSFCDAAVDYLSERDFVVMTHDELNEMLADARKEPERDEFGRIMDLPKAKAFDSGAEFQAGYNDAYNEEEKQGESEAYLAGYQAGYNAVTRELAEEGDE